MQNHSLIAELKHCIDNGREMVRAAGLVEVAAHVRRVNGDLHLATYAASRSATSTRPSHRTAQPEQDRA